MYIFHISDLHLGRRSDTVGILDLYQYIKTIGYRGALYQLLQNFMSNGFAGIKASRQSSYNQKSIDIFIEYVQEVCEKRTDTCVLVITGDISTTGMNEDLKVAKDFLESLTNQNPSLEIILLPGNHDRFKNKNAKPGGILFDSVLEKWWPLNKSVSPGHELERYYSKCIFDPQHKISIAFHVFDFSLPENHIGEWHDIPGRGLVCNNAILAYNKKQNDDGDITIWCLHFSPDSRNDNIFPEIKHKLRLDDQDIFLDLVAKARPNMVLFGHTHSHVKLLFEGTTYINSGTLCSADASQHEFVVTEIIRNNQNYITIHKLISRNRQRGNPNNFITKEKIIL